jgi:hypothetical protein
LSSPAVARMVLAFLTLFVFAEGMAAKRRSLCALWQNDPSRFGLRNS